MTVTREPFVSGLPGGDSRPPLIDPRGAAALARISAFAAAEAAALAPHTVDSFDGAEPIKADHGARAYKENFDLIVQLVDTIGNDQALMIAISALLVRGVGHHR